MLSIVSRIFVSPGNDTPHANPSGRFVDSEDQQVVRAFFGWSAKWKFFYWSLENCISWCLKQNLSSSCKWTWVWMFTSIGKIGMLSDVPFLLFENNEVFCDLYSLIVLILSGDGALRSPFRCCYVQRHPSWISEWNTIWSYIWPNCGLKSSANSSWGLKLWIRRSAEELCMYLNCKELHL